MGKPFKILMIFLLFSKIFRPDFDASREKLRRLGDAEGTLTKEEFNKMKQELEAEYLATFKVCNYSSVSNSRPYAYIFFCKFFSPYMPY